MAIRLALLLMTEALTYMYAEELVNFDFFELTLIYPESVCRAYNGPGRSITRETNGDVCKVPIDAAPWTIHGLW